MGGDRPTPGVPVRRERLSSAGIIFSAAHGGAVPELKGAWVVSEGTTHRR